MDERLEQIAELEDDERELTKRLQEVRRDLRRLNTITFKYSELKYFLSGAFEMKDVDIQAVISTSIEEQNKRRREELQRI